MPPSLFTELSEMLTKSVDWLQHHIFTTDKKWLETQLLMLVFCTLAKHRLIWTL